MAKRTLLFPILLFLSSATFAGNTVFLDSNYLGLTKQVVKEADTRASVLFSSDPVSYSLYVSSRDALLEQIETVERARIFKKLKPDQLQDETNIPFKDALNGFKARLIWMTPPTDRSPSSYLKSFAEWNRYENALDQAGTAKRLQAYEARFGSESEPINVAELLIGEEFMPGDSSGPSAWEPIFRISAVTPTNQGSGVTSTIEVGANHYFLQGEIPKVLRWVSVSNHLGAALALQYIEDPHIFNFSGRPSFGVMVHLDKKEAGLIWDNQNKKIRLTLGYAFQFIPLIF